ncbi:MAG TPA: hypothetical protein VIJ15_16235 [Dermatophilaceae bacterium]
MALTWLWGERGASTEEGAEGADGNARLTGAVGLVLLVVLFVEGVTLLEVRQLITLHIFVGLVLIPPTALKLASTIYRFVRYYTHSPSYVRHGPPRPLLRWTAPLLIIFTGAVLGTGVALLAVAPEQPGLVFTAHKVSFVGWFALMALHVVGHLKGAIVLSRRDWRRPDRAGSAYGKGLRGEGQRRGLVVASIVAGVALALALLPVASPWTTRPIREDGAATRGLPAVSAGGHPAASAQAGHLGAIAGESRWP